MRPAFAFVVFCAAASQGCAETSRLPDKADVGPNPTIVEPVPADSHRQGSPTAKGWRPARPRRAQGLKVNALVTGLDPPRWIHVLPNGDVLVAETNAPDRGPRTARASRQGS
jgi:glucose/arabinose dehydrogenase